MAHPVWFELVKILTKFTLFIFVPMPTKEGRSLMEPSTSTATSALSECDLVRAELRLDERDIA